MPHLTMTKRDSRPAGPLQVDVTRRNLHIRYSRAFRMTHGTQYLHTVYPFMAPVSKIVCILSDVFVVNFVDTYVI